MYSSVPIYFNVQRTLPEHYLLFNKQNPNLYEFVQALFTYFKKLNNTRELLNTKLDTLVLLVIVPPIGIGGSILARSDFSLEQRVHVQQVVLDGGPGDGPARTGSQLTDGHGGLHLWVFDVVAFVQDHPGPGHSQERTRV